MDFITFCGLMDMIFVYIVRNLILSLKTFLCISLMVSHTNLLETFEAVLTYFASFKKPISLFSKIQFLSGGDTLYDSRNLASYLSQ